MTEGAYPYNAGATGSDALRMGLPLVTCAGAAYASRIAGSLLHSLGLGDLVAHSIAQYERLAIALATDSTRLKKIRQTLRANLASSPLFDTPRFARHLEAAYLQMYERLCAGKPVADIRVAKTLESRLEPSPWLRALRRLGALFQSRSTTA
ncbi:MAG: hypothetical protein LW629_12490 [Burkholderiales bacterium]|nr:hypothetical protein [Burkholderiales bacterium]